MEGQRLALWVLGTMYSMRSHGPVVSAAASKRWLSHKPRRLNYYLGVSISGCCFSLWNWPRDSMSVREVDSIASDLHPSPCLFGYSQLGYTSIRPIVKTGWHSLEVHPVKIVLIDKGHDRGRERRAVVSIANRGGEVFGTSPSSNSQERLCILLESLAQTRKTQKIACTLLCAAWTNWGNNAASESSRVITFESGEVRL